MTLSPDFRGCAVLGAHAQLHRVYTPVCTVQHAAARLHDAQLCTLCITVQGVHRLTRTRRSRCPSALRVRRWRAVPPNVERETFPSPTAARTPTPRARAPAPPARFTARFAGNSGANSERSTGGALRHGGVILRGNALAGLRERLRTSANLSGNRFLREEPRRAFRREIAQPLRLVARALRRVRRLARAPLASLDVPTPRVRTARRLPRPIASRSHCPEHA